MTAWTAAFTCASQSGRSQKGASAKTGPSANASRSSSRVATSRVWSARSAWARSRRRTWASSRSAGSLFPHLGERQPLLGAVDPAHQAHRPLGEVSAADDDPQRDAAELPVGVLLAGAVTLTPVDPEPHPPRDLLLEPGAGGADRLGGLGVVAALDRHHDHLDRGDPRGQDQAAVVAVGHDHPADDPGRQPPRGLEGVEDDVVPAGVGDVVGAGEVLPEVVGRPRLERQAVGHDRLDRGGVVGAGELLRLRLAPGDHRHRQPVLGELAIAPEHPVDLLGGLLGGLVEGVPLLPEELGGAEEEPGPLLPADDVRPLVDEDGQVAPGVDPVGGTGCR